MPDFPSSVTFAAYLQYAPQGRSEVSRNSKDVVLAVKMDGFYRGQQVIPYAADRFARDMSKLGEHGEWFSPETTLIPAPKSAPLPPGGAVWPSFRICEELRARRLGGTILECLRRKVAIRKSATARGNRPDPKEHYESVEVVAPKRALFPSGRVLLVDDVVTRGSTFVGLLPRVREAFPEADVLCFALVRTRSQTEIEQIPDAVVGSITFDGFLNLQRSP